MDVKNLEPLKRDNNSKKFNVLDALEKPDIWYCKLPPLSSEKDQNLIDLMKCLENDFKEEKEECIKVGKIIRGIYIIALEGEEPLKERVLYDGHYKSTQNKYCGKDYSLICRIKHHIFNIRNVKKGLYDDDDDDYYLDPSFIRIYTDII